LLKEFHIPPYVSSHIQQLTPLFIGPSLAVASRGHAEQQVLDFITKIVQH